MNVDRADEVDVAIIGAGPGGLTAALAILKACPDLKVGVYERARALRPSGGCIGLSTPNVFAALEALGDDVLKSVRDAAVPRRNFMTADKLGNVLRTGAVASVIISWFDLQTALLDCLPDGVLTLNCGLQEVEHEDGGAVTLRMANDKTVRARLVVGADGNQSVCRRYVQGESDPEYVGAAVWRLFLPGDNPFVEVGDTLVMTGDSKVVVVQPTKRDKVVVTYCSGITGFDEGRLHELNQKRYVQEVDDDTQTLSAKLQRFQQEFDGFHPDLMAHIVENAVPESVLEHPMYALDPRKPWSRGNVVLLGDAAHVMPPNLSQGTPAAFEDSLQLASSLLTHGICAEALKEYEEARKERVLPVWDASTQGAVGYYREKREECNPFGGKVAGPHIFQLIREYQPPKLALA